MLDWLQWYSMNTLQRQTYFAFQYILCDVAKATNSFQKFCNQKLARVSKREHH